MGGARPTGKKGDIAMADFDIPGIGQARMNLALLADTPVVGQSEIKRALIDELYVEIRAARIAGHSWRAVAEAINSAVKMKISKEMIVSYFRELDKKYEAETGVRALPEQMKRKQPVLYPSVQKRGRQRKELGGGNANG